MSSAEQRMLRISLWCLVATLIVWTGTAGAGITATRVLGQPDFTHNATNTLSAGSLNFPGNHVSGAVVVDEINDHVYVADTGNNRVLGWQSISALTTGKFPDIVIGQLDFESAVAGTSPHQSFESQRRRGGTISLSPQRPLRLPRPRPLRQHRRPPRQLVRP